MKKTWKDIGEVYNKYYGGGVEFICDILPEGHRGHTGRPFVLDSLTYHNTGNSSVGADARAHNNYLKNNNNTTSWHITVDEKTAILHIPLNKGANHSGTRVGNDTSIGIEICENSDGDYYRAERNAAGLGMILLLQLNLNTIKAHKDWSGKNCPHIILREGRWVNYRNNIQQMAHMDSKRILGLIEQVEKGYVEEVVVKPLTGYEKEKVEAVKKMKELGVSDGTRLTDNVTRQESIVMSYRMYNLLQEELNK